MAFGNWDTYSTGERICHLVTRIHTPWGEDMSFGNYVIHMPLKERIWHLVTMGYICH